MNRKFLFLLAMALVVALSSHAQRERNYIYLFDCTSSMCKTTCDITSNQLKANPKLLNQGLYPKTKEWLKDDIEKITDPNTTITIIPFHQSTDKPITFCRNNFNWNRIEKALDKWIVESQRTGICNAWDKGLKYIDNTKDNYFFLLTDGKENYIKNNPCGAVEKRIRDWSTITNKNCYAFYVALSDEAYDTCSNLRIAVDDCERVYFIDKHIGPFGSFGANEICISGHDLKDKMVSFSAAGNYKVKVSCNDPYFTVNANNGEISNGSIKFHFEKKKDFANIKDSFYFTVTSKEVQITDSVFTVIVDNRPLPTLTIAPKEVYGGESSYYPKFLLWNAKEPDTLKINLGADWNDEAKNAGSKIDMAITCEELKDEYYKIYYNNTPSNDGKFTINSNDTNNVIKIVLDPSVNSGKYIFNIKGTGQKLDKINDENTTKYVNTIRIKHKVRWNPLMTILVWVGIILVAAILLWLIFFRPLFYRRFGNLQKSFFIPGMAPLTIRFKGARMVVVAAQHTKKQSRWNRFWTGKILYKTHPAFTTPITFKPTGKRQILAKFQSGSYRVQPNPMPGIGPATITVIQDKNTIDVN